jgi:hypothetical protein
MNSKNKLGNLDILSQHYDKKNRLNPDTEETGKTKLDEVATTNNKIFNNIPEDKLRRLEAICDRLSPRSAVIAEILPAPTIPKAPDDFYTRSVDVIDVSLPAQKAPDVFYKSQEADRKVIEGLDKEFERLKIETAEISKLLELQAEDTGNNGQTLTSPVTKKIRAHEAKNNDYIAWLKEETEHLEDVPKPYIFKEKKEDIQKKLINRNSQLWSFNFPEWWKQRPYKDIVIAKSGKR